jgi:hypothetical protein
VSDLVQYQKTNHLLMDWQVNIVGEIERMNMELAS